MPRRKAVDPQIEASILAQSARRCALCYHLDGNFSEQLGQIAHLDQNPSNGSDDNLAFLCMRHHSLYDSRTSQHKNYTVAEVKRARAKLYRAVEERKRCEWQLVLDGKFSDLDKPRIEALLQHLKTALEDPHITIKQVQSGSVRVQIESSQSTYERMRKLVRSGALTHVGGLRIIEVMRTPGEGGPKIETPPPLVEEFEHTPDESDTTGSALSKHLPPTRVRPDTVLWRRPEMSEGDIAAHWREIFNYIESRGVPWHVAEDMTEETVLRFLMVPPGDPKSSRAPKDLLRSIANGLISRALAQAGKEDPLGSVAPGRGIPSEFAIGSPRGSESNAGEVLTDLLGQAWHSLSPKEQSILALLYEGWLVEDIAIHIGASEEYVKRIKSNLRRKLHDFATGIRRSRK